MNIWYLWRRGRKKTDWVGRISDCRTMKVLARPMGSPQIKVACQRCTMSYANGPELVPTLCSVIGWEHFQEVWPRRECGCGGRGVINQLCFCNRNSELHIFMTTTICRTSLIIYNVLIFALYLFWVLCCSRLIYLSHTVPSFFIYSFFLKLP